MIERRWPWKTSRTRSCIWPCWASRKRTPALVIERSSSPTLKIAIPRTNAPPPVTILKMRSPTAQVGGDGLIPKPVTISASSAAGTFQRTLKRIAPISGIR